MNKDIDTNKVCHIQTLGITKNGTFIVDIDDVLFSNLIADDLGVWKKMEQNRLISQCLQMDQWQLLMENKVTTRNFLTMYAQSLISN